MSRFEGDFSAAGDASLSSAELLNLISANTALTSRQRQEAIACYLSASEGWDKAMKTLRGAFASEVAHRAEAEEIKANERAVNQRTSEYLQWPALKPAASDND